MTRAPGAPSQIRHAIPRRTCRSLAGGTYVHCRFRKVLLKCGSKWSEISRSVRVHAATRAAYRRSLCETGIRNR